MSDISFSASVDLAAYRGALKVVKLAKGRGGYQGHKARVEVSSDALILSATDFDLTVSTSIPATVGMPGARLVDAAWLFANGPKGRGTLGVVGNGSTWSLRNGVTATGPLDEATEADAGGSILPAFVAPVGDASPLSATLFAAMVEVSVAASRDEVRPVLCAVYVDGTTVAATDSYRLHAVNHGADPGPLAGCLLPLRLVLAAQAIGATTVAVDEGQRRATFMGPGGTVTGRLAEGNFPRYESLRERDSHALPVVLTLGDRDAALKSLAPMVTATRKGHQPVRFAPGVVAGTVDLSVIVDGLPAVAATVAGSLVGADVLAVSAAFLLDLLADGPVAPVLTTKGTTNPLHLVWHDDDCAEHWRLLMPVRV